jgi:hypothetical protein
MDSMTYTNYYERTPPLVTLSTALDHSGIALWGRGWGMS